MFTVAKVIVDVPSAQTNQTYDYLIPDSLVEDITIGYRVRVPFGNRQVLGFVVDIQMVQQSEYELKPIHSVLDTYPVLNHELIQLGHFLSETFFSFKISCYLTMLPALFKANYHKLVQWKGDSNELPELFNGALECYFDDFVKLNDITQLLKWQKEGKVVIKDVVRDKAKAKFKKVVSLIVDDSHIIVQKSAKKLALLVALLKDGDKDTKQLKENGVSLATVKLAQKKGWVSVSDVQWFRDPYADEKFEKSQPRMLNAEQKIVYEQVKDAVLKNKAQTFLLEGVTGSGKTEVYLQLIFEAISNGKTALFLVPEISLTPQMVHQFKSRFGERVAVLHSGLSNGERLDEWTKIREKKADIVVGARSSVFSPLENIGIIIIDEEHESSYKQMDGVRYHAREVAIWRGQYNSCPVVLGSATPSLESRARAHKNVYTLLTMTQRANQKALPNVRIIDMTSEKKAGNYDIFSLPLKEAIQKRLDNNEQIVLLLNRRGYSSFVLCRDCGYVVQCPNCDIAMTLHMDKKVLKCHYCDHQQDIPHKCLKCQQSKIRYFGIGTQKVEEELGYLFPNASVIRMDVDTTRKKGDHERLLKRFGQGKAQILLGTQMIAKGLDFPNITLVGVINADTSLNLPDFRAQEKTFQLLTQVSGRAGRGEKTGEVIIQTYNAEHDVLQLAKFQDYEQFYRKEMRLRHIGKYPPYYFTTLITVSHEKEASALQVAYQIKTILTQSMPSHKEGVIVIGPSAQSIARVNNRYYFQILLKYKHKDAIQMALDKVVQLSQQVARQKIYVGIDVEPMNFI